MLTRRELLYTAALAMVLPTCKCAPALSQTSRFGFFATKAIAEAGFIYGLPIVMSYAVMYEDAVDRQSGQFKAPFNRIKNEAHVLYIYCSADRAFTCIQKRSDGIERGVFHDQDHHGRRKHLRQYGVLDSSGSPIVTEEASPRRQLFK